MTDNLCIVLTDTQLVNATSGDDEAFASLLLDCYDDLARDISPAIPSRLRSYIDVHDVLQEAFTAAWLQVGGCEFRSVDAFYSWLRMIAKRRLIDEIRHIYATKRGGARITVPITCGSSNRRLTRELVDAGRSPSSFVALTEADDEVQAALKALAANHQEVLKLRFVEGLTAVETGLRLKSSEHAIHMMTRRALQKLRQKLGTASRFFSCK